jgi:hypothetical protein
MLFPSVSPSEEPTASPGRLRAQRQMHLQCVIPYSSDQQSSSFPTDIYRDRRRAMDPVHHPAPGPGAQSATVQVRHLAVGPVGAPAAAVLSPMLFLVVSPSQGPTASPSATPSATPNASPSVIEVLFRPAVQAHFDGYTEIVARSWTVSHLARRAGQRWSGASPVELM